jgi:hypothetical protein
MTRDGRWTGIRRRHLDPGEATLGAGVAAYGVTMALNTLHLVRTPAWTLLGEGWPLLVGLFGLLWLAESLRRRLWLGILPAAAAAVAGTVGGLASVGVLRAPAGLVWPLFWAALVVVAGLAILVAGGPGPVVRIGGRCRDGGNRPDASAG